MKQFIKETFFDASRTKWPEPTDIPGELFAELMRRWPQFQPPPGLCGFQFRAEVGSQVQKEVLAFLAEHGRHAVWGHDKSGPLDFRLSGEHEVEPADLARARFVTIYPRRDIAEDSYLPGPWEGWVRADRVFFKVPMGNIAYTPEIAVDAPMRDRMLAENFRGVSYRPIEIRGESPRAKPLWQICTDHVLPPPLPRLTHEESLPYDPQTGAPLPNHEFYTFWSPHRWRKQDLDTLGDADFFRSADWGKVHVSRRVYEWFAQQEKQLLNSTIPILEE